MGKGKTGNNKRKIVLTASNDYDNTIEGFKKNILDATMLSTRELADTIHTEIKMAFKSVIDDFYSSYNPKIYYRTHSTYRASNSDKLIEPEYKRGVFYPGISIGDDFITGSPYRNSQGSVDTEWVFNRTWYKGIHGFIEDELKDKDYYDANYERIGKSGTVYSKSNIYRFRRNRTSSGGYDAIENEMTKSLKRIIEVKKNGETEEMRDVVQYDGSRFSKYLEKLYKKGMPIGKKRKKKKQNGINDEAPPQMSPPPVELFEEQFNRICETKHVAELGEEILTKNLAIVFEKYN